ncbi:MAG TPA: Crp/Fnr family transcriptional regulator [Lamprocystis sp. (in: g-proteobacteria)]|nr:Crp/Fnr family transcriptional regulator [Lamprocystis sp. (in: g-proteobacteria)]
MIESLRRGPLLAGLTRGELDRVAESAVRVHLDEGQWLFSQGDPARRFYLVLQGQMRLFRISPEGAEKIIEIVSPDQTFAEALMFLNAPRYPVCAAALAPTDLIGIDAHAFAAMLRESVDTCFVVMGTLSRRLRGLIGEIDNLTLHTAKSRVARYLLTRVADDQHGFALEVPKGVLASRLSITPETLSRVLKQLTQEGLCSVHGAQVTITDHAGLTALAEFADSAELGAAPGAGG